MDPDRWDFHNDDDSPTTDIYVLARRPPTGEWDSVDIVFLDRESLMHWLRSYGGVNEFAENCVALLLGHSPQQ